MKLRPLLLTASTVFLVFLAGLPESPFTIISKTFKTKAKVNLEIPLPTAELAKNLGVGSCNQQKINSLYLSSKNYNTAKSGLNAFKSRLSNQYKAGSENFTHLSEKVLNISQLTTAQNKTCILPFKINVQKSDGINIPDSEVKAIDLGTENLYCSNGQSYVLASSKYFSITNSLFNYSRLLQSKQTKILLKKQIEALASKNRRLSSVKASQKAAIAKDIRKLNLSLAYTTYFLKEANLLAQFFNTTCANAEAKNTQNLNPSATVSPIPSAASTPDNKSNEEGNSTKMPGVPVCTSGQTEMRTMWKDPSAVKGQSCVSELQTWNCQNGSWERATGTFTNTSCSNVTMPSLASTGPRAASQPNITYTKFGDGDWRTSSGSAAPFYFANGDRDLIVRPGDKLVFKRINFVGSMNVGPIWNYYNDNQSETSVVFEDCTFGSLDINTVGKMHVTVSYSRTAYLDVSPGPNSQVSINNLAVVAASGGDAARIGRNKKQYGFDSLTSVVVRDSYFKTTGPSNPGDHRDVLQVFGASGVTLNNVVFDLNYGEYPGISPGQNVSLFLEDGTNGSISNIDIIDCWILGSGSYFLAGFQKRDWTTTSGNINVIRPKFSKGTSPLNSQDMPGFVNGYYKLKDPAYADDLSPIPLSYFGF